MNEDHTWTEDEWDDLLANFEAWRDDLEPGEYERLVAAEQAVFPEDWWNYL
jgi:hypothetical protein